VLKVLQLYETFNVRFGVMLVGETGAGKTVCYNILQKVMTYMREMKNHPDEAF
jgi:dynein heavy chain